MTKFKPADFAGLVSNPPQAVASLTDERMRDEIASIQNLKGRKLHIETDIDLGLTDEESKDG